MNRLPILGAVLLLGTSCGVTVEVQTDPVSQAIPVTSIGLDTYAEIAVDLPSASQGDIVIEQLTADVFVNNRSTASTMTFSARLSTEGTATPTQPFLFSAASKPAYFDKAFVILTNTPFAPNLRVAQHIDATQLKTILGKPRVWLIVSNTISKLGLGDALPLEVRLEELKLHAVVSKSLQSANGALDLTGL